MRKITPHNLQGGSFVVDLSATNAVGTGHAALTLAITSTFASWKSGFFDSQQQSDPGISGDDADPDMDGLSNLLEYALHSDPTQASAAAGPGFRKGLNSLLASSMVTYGVWSSTISRPVFQMARPGIFGKWAALVLSNIVMLLALLAI